MTRYVAKPIKIANCLTCDKQWHGPNAHAVGVIHARKYKHKVGVEVIFTFVYDETDAPEICVPTTDATHLPKSKLSLTTGERIEDFVGEIDFMNCDR